MISTQTHHVPKWTHPCPNPLLFVYLLSSWMAPPANRPSTNLKDILILYPFFIVLTQALINYLLPVLLHFPVSSFAAPWTLNSALQISSSSLHPWLCTHNSLYLEYPPSCSHGLQDSAQLSAPTRFCYPPRLGPDISMLNSLFVETYIKGPITHLSIFHLPNHPVNC